MGNTFEQLDISFPTGWQLLLAKNAAVSPDNQYALSIGNPDYVYTKLVSPSVAYIHGYHIVTNTHFKDRILCYAYSGTRAERLCQSLTSTPLHTDCAGACKSVVL